MIAQNIDRHELLDDPRFWALLYVSPTEAVVGDTFDCGVEHFFGVGEDAQYKFYDGLAQFSVQHGFPSTSSSCRSRTNGASA